MAASKELSIKSSKASSLFLKFRFHDLQSPLPSTLVNGSDDGGDDVLNRKEEEEGGVVVILF